MAAPKSADVLLLQARTTDEAVSRYSSPGGSSCWLICNLGLL